MAYKVFLIQNFALFLSTDKKGCKVLGKWWAKLITTCALSTFFFLESRVFHSVLNNEFSSFHFKAAMGIFSVIFAIYAIQDQAFMNHQIFLESCSLETLEKLN